MERKGCRVRAGRGGSNEEEQRDVSVVPAEVLPGVRVADDDAEEAAVLGPRPRLWPSLAAVYRAQLSRARVARIPLLFVATFQSIGIMIMLRGVVSGGTTRGRWWPARPCSWSPTSG